MAWWHGTTIYQVYPRSFADGNGDGVGDLRGLIAHLDHIRDLGAETVWVSPFFPSPQRDFGYDVTDYGSVAPEYGTLADADELIAQCHRRGMRVLFDLVLNHTSDEHPWFRESRRSRTNPRADWYVWRDGRGRHGRRPPNNWRSNLELRSAWQWSPGRGQWYLASFLPWQPDLDWRNPQVREAMFDVVRFWLDRGVDGFRLDMFGTVMKDEALRDNPFRPTLEDGDLPRLWRRPFNRNTEDNFTLARDLRAVTDAAPEPERILLGEVFGRSDELSGYLADGHGLHLVFLFDLLAFRYDAGFFRRLIAEHETAFPWPAQPAYALENHDQTRSIDLVGGDLRKARVLAVLLLTMRGVACVYQGQEIGLPNTYVPLRDARDPMVRELLWWLPEAVSRRLRRRVNRDEMRTPMPWTDAPGAGFCPDEVVPWLPIGHVPGRNVAAQAGREDSLLELYRRLLHLRGRARALREGTLRLLPTPRGVLGYARRGPAERWTVLANLTGRRARHQLTDRGELAVGTDPDVSVTGRDVRLAPHSAAVIGHR
ncbi:MAG: alpha-amylase [Streptosporangiales bacterium]|nr:alpha-amylase [Streptosporangiales bacterium]MBO0890082.1 hypothetical protein [Acidothermales bacterium]